jgi:uncharacterized protein (DUF433 family)
MTGGATHHIPSKMSRKMPQTVATHIDVRPNRAGQPRAFIEGTRVRVQDIYALAEVQGKTPDEIVQALPHISLAQVHAALSYYFDHREAIVQEMREDTEFVSQFRAASGQQQVAGQLKAPGPASDSITRR